MATIAPTEAFIRNLFRMQGIGTGISRETRAMLAELFDEMSASIAKAGITGRVSDSMKDKRVVKLLDKIEELAGERFIQINEYVIDQLAIVGAAQTKWATELLRKATGVNIDLETAAVNKDFAARVLTTDPILGETLADTFTFQSDALARNFAREVKLGLQEGETMDDILARVEGLQGAAEIRAEAMVRTAVNDICNTVHMEVYSENSDVVSKVRFVATLDSRTSFECMANDGKVWDIGDPDIQQPPLHPNCRSMLVPEIDYEKLGISPPPDDGERASADGPVSSDMNYEEWLKTQSDEMQNSILGESRADLFRDDKISLKDLIKSDGRIVPVDDLT